MGKKTGGGARAGMAGATRTATIPSIAALSRNKNAAAGLTQPTASVSEAMRGLGIVPERQGADFTKGFSRTYARPSTMRNIQGGSLGYLAGAEAGVQAFRNQLRIANPR